MNQLSVKEASKQFLIVTAFTMCLTCVTSSQARGFASYVHWVHDEIIKSALNGTCFQDSAVKLVQKSARRQDWDESDLSLNPLYFPAKPNNAYRPDHHFDRDRLDDDAHSESKKAFERGFNYMHGEQELAIAYARLGQTTLAQEALGRALHALQDFFAHSNYVELSNGEQSQILSVLMSGNYSDPTTRLQITGYFINRDARYDPEYFPGDTYSHRDNAKDWDTKNAVARREFGAAKQAATSASARLVAQLLAAAGDNLCRDPSTAHSAKSSQSVTSGDPNELAGSLGFGTPQWIGTQIPLHYATYFSNIPTATAPAQFVLVTDHLDPTTLDITTVNLESISFAGQTVTPTLETSPPVGKRQFNTDVDLRPSKNLVVHINAVVDMLTGDLTWTFTSIDPATGMPPEDPLAGFLDPGQEGSVLFSVMPKAGIPTGTVVTNQAEITFDFNAPMATNVWFNTIDSDPPLSLVNKLAPQQSAVSFPVSWKTADVGSGVRDITILVSDNNGPFTPWLTNTTDTSATFSGLNGHTYAFKSRARDNVYNLETEHAAADTVTKVVAGPPKFFLQSATAVRTNGVITVTGTLKNSGGDVAKGATIKLASAAKLAGVNTTSAVPINLGDIPVNGTKDFTLTFPGSITAGSKVLQVQVSFNGGSSTATKAVAVP